MTKKAISLVAATTIFFLIAGCGNFTKIKDSITKPSERQIYERNAKTIDGFAPWQSANKNALLNSVSVSLPYGEKGSFNAAATPVYSYEITMNEGEILEAKIIKDTLEQVFMEVYQWNGKEFKEVSTSEGKITHAIEKSGVYKLLVQPQIAAKSGFALAINKNPSYRFPVSGKGNSAIGSFWNDPRDGGKRSHEGIDIFASRGTPVIAVADGSIGFSGERGIGGKQVWLRTGLFQNSVYYAHLDRIAVSDGDRVKLGDTLGFVGNTGNAKTTVPHLHFGIYTNSGAVNPLPFVFQNKEISLGAFPQNFKSNIVKVSNVVNLRSGPSEKYAIADRLQPESELALLGQHHDWLHVETSTGRKGFVSRKLVRAL